jgi:hypothetical protein
MKNTIKLIGFIAVVAVIGLSFVACDEPEENVVPFENRSTYDVTVTVHNAEPNPVTFTLKGFISGTGNYASRNVTITGTTVRYNYSPENLVERDEYELKTHGKIVFVDIDAALSVRQ